MLWMWIGMYSKKEASLYEERKVPFAASDTTEPLFVQYDAEPIQVDPNGCKNIAELIKKAQKEFSPQLDSFPLAKLTPHRCTGTKLRPGLRITELLKQAEFENSDSTPLFIRYADALLPVIKNTMTAHPSEERKKEKMGRT